MAKCKFCGKPVTVSPVWHDECWEEAVDKIAAQICDGLCKYRDIYGEDEEALNRECCDTCVVHEVFEVGQ